MKKWLKILIVALVIVIALIIIFFIYKYFKMTGDYQYCISDSDCKVQFNYCSCSNYCSNGVGGVALAQCIKTKEECDKDTNKVQFSACQCSNNKCIQGFLKD